jgi:diadenosine tetraphosphate (Ap4A) HIT family hydrolase
MIRTIALLCLLALAPMAAAQEAPHDAEQAAEPTARQAMAKVIAEAMVPTSRYNYGRDWDALSVRISRHLHWHLAPPDEVTDITSTTGIRRNGWIEDGKEQIGVSAYGFQTVDSLTFALSPRFASTEPEEDDTIIAALTAIGVTPSPAPSPPNFSGIATTVWNLDAEGRDQAHLTRSILCTPEGSAAARMCGATYEVVLKQ